MSIFTNEKCLIILIHPLKTSEIIHALQMDEREWEKRKKDIGILNWFIFIHFELKPKINIELFIIYSDLDQP